MARPASSSLPPRIALTVVAGLGAVTAVAWIVTARHAGAMAGMAMGLAQVGTRMPPTVAAPLFLAMWTSMMVAMMLPAAAPMVLAHRMVTRHRGEGSRPTVAFVAGYLLVWAAVGVVPMLSLVGFRVAVGASWLRVLAGTVLVGAGLYQLSTWKDRCLRVCRSPLGFVLSHDFAGGVVGALRAGVSHGAWCLGCCWSLMAVLVVVGLMNLVWMAGLAVELWVEKTWRHGVGFSRMAGTAMVALGAAVLAHPELLARVA